jgi:hypothetical protein
MRRTPLTITFLLLLFYYSSIQPEINGPNQCITVLFCNETQADCKSECEGSRIGGSGSGNTPGSIPLGRFSTYYANRSLLYHTNTDYPDTDSLDVPYWMNQFKIAVQGGISAPSPFSLWQAVDGQF